MTGHVPRAKSLSAARGARTAASENYATFVRMRWRVLAIAVLLAGILAGCGGPSEDPAALETRQNVAFGQVMARSAAEFKFQWGLFEGCSSEHCVDDQAQWEVLRKVAAGARTLYDALNAYRDKHELGRYYQDDLLSALYAVADQERQLSRECPGPEDLSAFGGHACPTLMSITAEAAARADAELRRWKGYSRA
jgi:hypothetical protein